MENAPIFVKIDEYKKILKMVDTINKKLETIKKSMNDLRDVKSKEDDHMRQWEAQLGVVSEKMNYINNTLKEM